MIIKRRRIAAYRFLKHSRLMASGRGKIITLDLAMIPKNMDIKEFLKNCNYSNRHNMILNSK